MQQRSILLGMLLLCQTLCAAPPTPDHPTGWRGDNTGHYPDAAPPVEWHRLEKTAIADFTSIPSKPADQSPAGARLHRFRGSFSPDEWLILGPFPSPEAEKIIDKETIPGESAFAPSQADRAGDLSWKKTSAVGSLNFTELFGKTSVEQFAFLSAYFYAPADTAVTVSFSGNHGFVRMWLNGKTANMWDQERHKFLKGWNHLLLKVVVRPHTTASTLETYLSPPDGPDLEYETKNIAWITEMPGSSYSIPTIVGDKLFVTSEPSDLLCVDKKTGKILWMRSETLWHGATGSEPREPLALRIVGFTDKTLTFSANTALDKIAAVSAASYAIPGAQIVKAELSPHATTVRLTAAERWPWKLGDAVSLKTHGLKSTTGHAFETDLSAKYLPGRVHNGEPLREFLLGDVIEKIDPSKSIKQSIPDEATLKPAPNDVWKLYRPTNTAGLFDLNQFIGQKMNAAVQAAVYLHSDAPRKIQLSMACEKGLRLVVNGAMIYADPTNHGLDAEKLKIADIPLQKGWNTLLLTIAQSAGSWGFSIRLLDATGQNPADGVTYQALPPDQIDDAPPADENTLDQFRPMVSKLESMTDAFIAGNTILPGRTLDKNARPEEQHRWPFEQRKSFLEERRRLAQAITDGVKKTNPNYGVSLGWGGGNCVPTPTSDGQFIYTWHGETGILSCFDFEGNRIYTRFQHSGAGGEHGINGSPQIVGDKIIVIGGQRWLAFHKKTGLLAWTQKYTHPAYATAIPAKIGDVDILIGPDGQILRTADGTVLQKAFGRYDGECASPVFDEKNPRRFYLIARGGFIAAELPETITNNQLTCKVITKLAADDLQDTETYPVGSPLSHDGLVYATHSGWGSRAYPVLFAIDPEATPDAAVLYRQRLDLNPALHYAPDGAGVASSLTLVNNHVYCVDNRGETIVFSPGRTFKQIAKNVIEDRYNGREEVTNSTPIFDENRMYYRGEHNLYCIGQK